MCLEISTHDSHAFNIKTEVVFSIRTPPLAWRPKSSEVRDQQPQSIPYDSLVGNDQPKDLWDRAHRLLREDKSKSHLLLVYERILAFELNVDTPLVASADCESRERSVQVSDLGVKKLKVIEVKR